MKKKVLVTSLLATMTLGFFSETVTTVALATTDSGYNLQQEEKFNVRSKSQNPVSFENLTEWKQNNLPISDGTEVRVFEEQTVADVDYYYVSIENRWGWVEASSFTTVLSETEIDADISIVNGSALIYEKPERDQLNEQENFNIEDTVYPTVLKVETSEGEYYQIYDNNQEEGWIKASDAEVVQPTDNSTESSTESTQEDESATLEESSSDLDETSQTTESSTSEEPETPIVRTKLSIQFEYGVVAKSGWDIWEKPFVSGVSSIGKSTNYYNSGEIVRVTQREQTPNGTYVLIQTNDGNGYKDLGWINESGLSATTYKNTTETYEQFSKKNWDIWNTPYSTKSTSVGKTTDFMSEKLLVKKTAQTKFGTYNNVWRYNSNTKSYEDFGWVNASGLAKLSEQVIENTYVTLKVNNWDIWDSPYTNQSKSVAKTTTYNTGEILLITRSAKTNSGSYYRVFVDNGNGFQALGWVRDSAVQSAKYQVIPNEYKRINKANWTIWDTPYSKRSKSVGNTNDFRAQTILLTRKATTVYGTYVKIWAKDSSGSFKDLGWLNADGLVNYDEKVVPNAYVTITKNNWDVWEQPYTTGVKSVAKSQNFSNQTLLVTREAKVGNTLYLRIWSRNSNGNFEIRGWINANGTSYGDRIISQKDLNENMRVVTKRNWTIWEKPYVTGVKQKNNSTSYLNKNVVVKKEAVTNYGTYVLIVYQGKELGWINKDGLSTTNKYILDSAYYSQTTIGAWSGCAAVSLFTALRMKGYAGNVSLTQMINNLPLHSSNPDLGQIGSPWKGSETFRAVITPVGLTKYAQQYTKTATNFSNSSIDAVQKEIMLGNPVLFWGKWNMGYQGINMTPTHVLIIRGYEKTSYGESFLVQDVGFNSANLPGAVRWVSKSNLNNYLTSKQRKMMVIR
jgi:uncharacterized protein YvpB/DNA-directed RNA polymerase subunit H (RpoH/RPB5)